MKWLKSIGSSVVLVVLAALAIFATAGATRQKANARKWQGKAEDIEAGNVESATLTAEAASTKAKLHNAKADELKAKAEQRITAIGEKDEEVADILDRWRKS